MPSSRSFRRAAACAAALMMTSALQPPRLRRTTPVHSPDRSTPEPRTVGSRRSGSTTGRRRTRAFALGILLTGTGTAFIRWGLLVLDSSVDRFSEPSRRGWVTTVLRRHGEATAGGGARLVPPLVRAGRDYKVFAELVPVDPTKAGATWATSRWRLLLPAAARQRLRPQRGEAVDLHETSHDA